MLAFHQRICAGASLLMLVLTLSCGTKTNVLNCPDCRVGAVEGRVLAGGAPVVVPVGARCADGVNAGWVKYQTTTDSTGWYRLDMPVGPYRIEVRPCNCGTFPVRDTIHVGPTVTRMDFHMGAATFRLQFPRELAESAVKLSLHETAPTHDLQLNYQNAHVTRDGSVKFQFPVLNAAGYRMSLDLPGSNAMVYLPGTTEPDLADTISVPSDRPFLYEKSLEFLGTVSGWIHGSWQSLGAYAPTVYAVGATDSAVLARCTTNSSGDFEAIALDARPVKLLSEIGSITQWFGGDSFASATEYRLEPGGRVTGANLTESGIRCQVVPAGADPVNCLDVLIRDEAGRDRHAFRVSTAASLCNLRPGRHYVRVSPWCAYPTRTWAYQWYDGASLFSHATPIDLGQGQSVTITMQLAEGASISGWFRWSDGSPNHDFELTILDASLEPLISEGPGYLDGSFEFPSLPDGNYYLKARSRHAAVYWYQGTADPDSADVVTIANGQPVSGLDWRLPPPQSKVLP